MEKDSEQGIAHYLEHLEFEGSTHFPPGEMIKYFQRIGMSHGADTNAHTWLDETVYKLDLPDHTDEYLKNGFTVMRDFAGGLDLHEDIINRERGVILAEKRQRDSVFYRTYVAQLSFLLDGTLIPKRLPIGKEENIEAFALPDFQRFYNEWYTPERMLLVIAGDISPKEIVPYIKEYFSSLKSKNPPQASPALGELSNQGKTVALLHSEPEAEETNVAIHNVVPFPYNSDSKARFVEELSVSVANVMMNRRLSILSKEKNAPFTVGASYTTELVNAWMISAIELTCQPDKWEACLGLAEQELRKALDYGFTKSEFEEAKAVILNDYQQEADQAKTKRSPTLANEIVKEISGGLVYLSPEQKYTLAQEAFTIITPASITDVFRKAWNQHSRYIFISGNLSLKNPEQEILKVYENSKATEVIAPIEKTILEFKYTDFKEPGKVASIVYQDDLDIYQIRFQNNVYLNLKSTKFEANTIQISVRFGGGLLESIKDKPRLDVLTNMTFIQGGLQKHSIDELTTIFAGKTVSVNFRVDNDAFALSGITSPVDLRDQLNLMLAYIIEPGYREEALRQAHKEIDQLYIQLANTPEGIMQNQVARLITSNDNRFGFPEKVVLLSYTLDDVRDWLNEPLSNGFMEISIVGDFDIEAAIRDVALTFGTLPERNKIKPNFEKERLVYFPKNIHEKTFLLNSEIPKALVAIYWPTDDTWDISQTRKLGILANIIDERLRIELREKMGETYTSFAMIDASETFKDYGYLLAISIVDPENIDIIADATLKVTQDLYANGITEDEFERAIKPTINNVKVSARNNKYWLNLVLGRSQEYPQRLDWARNRLPEFLSFTVKDIMDVAKSFLINKDALLVKITPAGNYDEDAAQPINPKDNKSQ